MSDQTAYFVCMGCGWEDRSYPADMMGVTKDGDLWCWDCPSEIFHDDDPNKPVLEPFVPEWEVRIAELEAENAKMKAILQKLHTPGSIVATQNAELEAQLAGALMTITELEKKNTDLGLEIIAAHGQAQTAHEESASLRKLAQAAVDSNIPGQLKETYAALDALAKHLEETK